MSKRAKNGSSIDVNTSKKSIKGKTSKSRHKREGDLNRSIYSTNTRQKVINIDSALSQLDQTVLDTNGTPIMLNPINNNTSTNENIAHTYSFDIGVP